MARTPSSRILLHKVEGVRFCEATTETSRQYVPRKAPLHLPHSAEIACKNNAYNYMLDAAKELLLCQLHFSTIMLGLLQQ